MTSDQRNRSVVRWLVAGAIPIILGLAVVAVARTFDRTPRIHGSFTMEEARSFQGFAIYNAGASVSDLPLVAILRRSDAADYVSFIYGRCENVGGNACAPPMEIQTWPACRRHLGLYTGPQTPTPERATIRGAPAAFFEGGRRLEIQTGRSTIVVFGRSREEVLEVADAVRGVNAGIPPQSDLPPPAPGALIGGVACGF